MNFYDINYKGYSIGYNYFDNKEYSVFYCGDDVIFYDLDDATKFIDDVSNNNNLTK